MSFSQDIFIQKAKEYGRSDELIESLVKYAQNLTRQDLPVIYTTHHLSAILGVSYDELKKLIDNRAEHYKYYTIKKRSGNGVRQIISPYTNLKGIQDFIYKEILSKVEIHPQSFAFAKGKSILNNALGHENQGAIMNIDLARFFDTITENRVYGIFKSFGYMTNLCVDLAKICTVILPKLYLESFSRIEYKDYCRLVKPGTAVLPQGAPTSPALSNLVLRRLDKRLYILANKHKLNYSRYADDLTLSGDYKNLPKLSLIKHIITEEGFNINWRKVGTYKKGQKQIVTGLTVSNGVHVHRNFKKDVKKHIFSCIKFGVAPHMVFLGIPDKRMYREWLLGKIFFIKSIEPETSQKLLSEFNKIEWPLGA